MGERGLTIRSGVNRLGWEEADFPIVCNPCLGDNPYIRMLRERIGRQCRICDRPYTVFRWRPGRAIKAKMTEICQTCSKLKNACQGCLKDLDFKMSMTERDQFLGDKRVETPYFEANRDYWAEQANRNLPNLMLPYDELPPTMEGILKEPRIMPARNPEAPIGYVEPALNDTGDVNDLMIQEQFRPKGLLAPDDQKICSLYISHMNLDINEGDIKDVFDRHGKIDSIKVMDHGQSAFVNYANRKGAETAINALFNDLVIKDVELKLQWARQSNKNFSIGNLLKQIKPGQQLTALQTQGVLRKPVPPKMPPQNAAKTPDLENKFLFDIMEKQSKISYPSQDPYMNGGARNGAGTLKQQEI